MSKGKLGAVGRLGLTGAPAAAERVGAQVSEPVSSQARELAEPQARDVVTPQAHGAAVARPVQYTLRLSLDESDQLDGAARAQRRALSRAVNGSEILRTLIGLVSDDAAVRAAVTDRLRQGS